ncbi:MAG: hypothetical protein NVSMB62_02270 [Acidobacteriaceae bacterium]
MTALAMWFQDATTSTGGVSAETEKYIVIFLGLIAFSMVVQALVYIAAGIVAMKAMKAADNTVQEVKGAIAEVRRDLKTSTDEIKAKVYPVIESMTHLGKTAQGILDEATPKLRLVSDHIVETSRVVRDSAVKFQGTAADVNHKTQRQVARVDGMVTAALDTTAEVVATIEHGIKVPAQKIASAAVQARHVVEGVLERVKTLTAGLPFLQGKGPAPARPRPYPASTAPAPPRPTGNTPASATGRVPLVR